jgi:hypothetical protein
VLRARPRLYEVGCEVWLPEWLPSLRLPFKITHVDEPRSSVSLSVSAHSLVCLSRKHWERRSPAAGRIAEPRITSCKRVIHQVLATSGRGPCAGIHDRPDRRLLAWLLILSALEAGDYSTGG